MDRRPTNGSGWQGAAAVSLIAACGLAQSIRAQESVNPAVNPPAAVQGVEAPAPAAQPAPAAPAPVATPAPASPRGMRFNFKDAPFDQVLDLFARESGLPIINEAKIPEGTVTFISAGEFDFDGALSVLNQILLLHRVSLRREGDYLYLADIKRAVATGGPVYIGEVPSAAGAPAPADIVTLAIPLSNAKAEIVAEQVKKMIADYGAVTPIPGQNLIILVETAAQAKRIQGIVNAIDNVREVDSAYKVFPLKHAKPDAIFGALKGLLGERQKTVVFDKDGNQRTINDVSVTGLNLQPDPRTNSIIAVGSAVRLKIVEELIGLLDVPDAGELDRESRTVTLRTVTPASAAGKLAQFYAALPAEQRPTTIPLEEQNKLTLVGKREEVARGLLFLMEIDPGARGPGQAAGPEAAGDAASDRVARRVLLKHVQAGSVEPIVMRLASPKEQQSVRVASAPDGRGLLIVGPQEDVASVERLIATIDVPADAAGAGQVQIIRLKHADASQVATNLQAVLAEDKTQTTPATVRVDPASNSLIARGSVLQLAQIEKLASEIDAATAAASRQMRLVPIDRSKSDAAAMAQTLQRMMQEQGSGRVEVITLEELLKRSRAEHDKPQGSGSPDAAGQPSTKPDGSTTPPPAAPATPVAPTPSGGESPPATPPRVMLNDAGLFSKWVEFAISAMAIGQPTIEAPATTPDDLTIAVDPATNSLIVVGSQRATDRLAELAARVQVQIPAEPTKLRLIDLPPGTDPWSLVQIVNQAIAQLGRVGPGNPSGFTGNVSIYPDPTGSTLITWANDTDFAAVGELLAAVSKPGVGNSEITIKVYPLTGAPAWSVVQSIRDLLSSAPRGAQARAVRSAMAFTLKDGDGHEVKGAVDPSRVRITNDPAGTSVIVAAPAEAIPMIDRFIELIDQTPTKNLPSIKRYTLANARAEELAPMLQRLFEAQRQGAVGYREGATRPQFMADSRTNTILVTASEPQHVDVTRLVGTLDESVRSKEAGLETTVLTLQYADPSTVRSMIDSVLIGRDPAKRDRIRFSIEDGSGLMIARAGAEDLAEIKRIVDEVESAMGGQAGDGPDGKRGPLAVRTLKVERADAQAVATGVQRFFQDRAQVTSRGGRRNVQRVAIVGDRRSGTIAVSANDADYEQIKELVSALDMPAPSRQSQFKIVQLKHARTTDINETIESISNDLQWERITGVRARGGAEGPAEEQLVIRTNDRTNTVLLFGQGEVLDLAMKVITELDSPQAEQERTIVKPVIVAKGDLRALASVIESVTSTQRERGWWNPPDPERVEVEIDAKRRMLLLIGKATRVDQAAAYLDQLVKAGGEEGGTVQAVTLQHAPATRAAESLRRFFAEQAQAKGTEPAVSVIGSSDGNVIILSATGPEAQAGLALAQELIGKIDQPEIGSDRRIEVIALKNAKADDAIRAVTAIFPSSGRADDRVLVTPVAGGQSVAVSSPADKYEQIENLLKLIDAPPKSDDAKMATVKLKSARATEVSQALAQALPASVAVKVTPIARNNTLLLTGSDEAVKLVMERIEAIDAQPEVSMEFRRVSLQHAVANDVVFTLRQLLRSRPRSPGDAEPAVDASYTDNTLLFSGTPDQLRDIEKMIASLDVPAAKPTRTEFVKLEFAKAEPVADALEVFYGRWAIGAKTAGAKNVTIVPDPASNSLVVSADADEWIGIRELLKKLDTEEYDTSRQLAVIALKHADAASVSRSLNEAFRTPLEDRARREQSRIANERRGSPFGPFLPDQPSVLVDDEGAPMVSAEAQTNSLIVFAGQREMKRIKALVEQIDVESFARLPEAVVIPLKAGKASVVAQTIRDAVSTRRQGSGLPAGPRSPVIIGDDGSDAIIVRAEERDLAEIKALAESLQQRGEIGRASVRTIVLKNIPAARLQRTLLATFLPQSQQEGETLAIEAERGTNSLVVASSERLFEQIQRVVKELDTPLVGPAAAKPGDQPTPTSMHAGVTIVELKHTSAEQMKGMLEQMGATRGTVAGDDRPGIVREPVQIQALVTRRAIAVVGSPGDAAAIESLVKTLDAEPVIAEGGEQTLTIIAMRQASAVAVANTLKSMINPAQSTETAPARAMGEHLRRLNIARNGTGNQPELKLDLNAPIRLIPDAQTNSIAVSSTPDNVASLKELIKSLDALPVGDAVVVRFFPLQNAACMRVKGVIDDLFRQGEALRRLPGTDRRGLPTTATGRALAGEIAVTPDERTNTIIVAGREEAVAFVEVLVQNMDSAEAGRWVEPRILMLKHADPVRLAQQLNALLVQRTAPTPEAQALQRQVARLRIAKQNPGAINMPFVPADPSAPPPAAPGAVPNTPAINPAFAEADLFAPMAGVVIEPQPEMRALVIVATPANLEVVQELVKQLDVESASPANTVRVFPLVRASADRVSANIQDLFRQREGSAAPGTFLPEDKVSITPDSRTNSLVVSTSARSFAIVDALIKTLDAEQANPTVSVHVVAVPNGDAVQLAPKIGRVMRERLAAQQLSGATRSAQDVFSIEADAANNVLVVACSEENLKIIEELVTTLALGGEARGAEERRDLIQLKSGRAADIADVLQQVYVSKEVAKRGAGAVTVIANDRLNAILITGNERDLVRLRELAGQVETAPVLAEQLMKRIRLRSANANEVVIVLREMLSGRGAVDGRPGSPRQAVKLKYLRDAVAKGVAEQMGHPATEAQIDGLVRELVSLAPDLRSNSVMVTAPKDVMALVEEIVADLDTTELDRQIRLFPLKNADARATADLLRDVFNLRQQGNQYVLVPTGPQKPEEVQPTVGPVIGSGNVAIGAEGSTFTPVIDQRQQLSIAIDARTNTLVVSGTLEYLDRVGRVIQDLDQMEATERDRIVYHLRNAKAKEAETTLKNLFSGETDLQRQLLGPDQAGSVMRQLEQEVTVVGDEKSNKLLITVSPRYATRVMELVKEIDSAPPQVTIQVLLAEVAVDSSDTWGMDFKLKDITGEKLNVGFLGASAGVAAALGVPNLSFSSADFEVLVRALEVQGKLQVLSRPSVTANNNERAEINVGDNVAVVTDVENLDNGNTRANIERRDLGITLNVTPSISADGFVRMELEPSITGVSQRSTQISEDFIAPIFTQRKVKTTVTVKDGQTVVIGGLIETKQEQRRTKVPLLGDIPALGEIFKSSKTEDVKTELLVILTPKVIYNDRGTGVSTFRNLSEQQIDAYADPQEIRDVMERDGMYERPGYSAPWPAIEPTPMGPSGDGWGQEGEPSTEPAQPHAATPSQPIEATPPPPPPVAPGSPTPTASAPSTSHKPQQARKPAPKVWRDPWATGGER